LGQKGWQGKSLHPLTFERLSVLLVNSLKTSKEVWNGLCGMFETKHATTKVFLNQKLYSMKISEEESIVDHLNNFKSIIERLATVGVAISNEDSVVALLSTLPESYDGRVFLSGQTILTLQIVVDLLLYEEVRSKSIGRASNLEKPIALFIHKKQFETFSKKKYESREPQNFPKKVEKCFYCQKLDHHIKDCRKRIAKKRRKQVNNVIDSPLLFILSFPDNITESDKWYLDLGATQHMTPCQDWFLRYFLLSSHARIFLGDDTSHIIKGYGAVAIKLEDKSKRHIENVYHIPGLKKELISVSKIIDVGYKLEFNTNLWLIKDITNNLVLFSEKRERNLYSLGISRNIVLKVENDQVFITTKIPSTKVMTNVDLWHQCLGHICLHKLQFMHTKYLVHGLHLTSSHKLSLCPSCLKGNNNDLYSIHEKHIRPLIN